MRFGAGSMLIELTRQSIDAGVRPPAEVALLGRTLLALEAVAAVLSPHIDARRIVREHLQSVVSDRISQDELRRWLENLGDEDLGRYKM